MTLVRLRARRSAALIAFSAAGLLLGAGTAFAHVTVSPGTVAPGSYTTLSFRVPTESDSASTTKVEIQIPAETPLPTVLAEHTSGWTVELTESDLPAPVTQGDITLTKAVRSVTFTAADAGIAPGEFAVLDLLVGPIPDVESISFATVQTYSDGTVVSWNEPTPAGGEEPEHPAPLLNISDTAGNAGGESEDHDHASVTATTPGTDAAGAADSHPDSTSLVLAIVALVLGAAALLAALVALRRRPGPSSPARAGTPGPPPTDQA